MRCAKCSFYNPDNLKLTSCHACGAPLQPETKAGRIDPASPDSAPPNVSESEKSKRSSEGEILYPWTLVFALLAFLIFAKQVSSEYYLKNVRGSFGDGLLWIFLGPIVFIAIVLLIASAYKLFKQARHRPAITALVLAVVYATFPIYGPVMGLVGHALFKTAGAKISGTKSLYREVEKLQNGKSMYFGSAAEKELQKRQPELIKIIKSSKASYDDKKQAFKYLINITDDLAQPIIEIAEAILLREPQLYDVYHGWPLEQIKSSGIQNKEALLKRLESAAIKSGVDAYVVQHIGSFPIENSPLEPAPKRENQPETQTQEEYRRLQAAINMLKAGRFKDATRHLEALWNDGGYVAYEKRFSILEGLATGYEKLEIWEKATLYQKMLLENTWGSQDINRHILKFRYLQSRYKQGGGTKEDLLAEELPVNYTMLREHIRGFGRYASEVMGIDKAASYFYTKLRFDEAEHYTKLAIAVRRKNEVDGMSKKYDTSESIMHERLRNLYMIRGEFSNALKEQDWIIKNITSKSPYLLLQLEHEKSVLEYVIAKSLSNSEIIYNSLSTFDPRFELQQENWKSYEQKEKELRASLASPKQSLPRS